MVTEAFRIPSLKEEEVFFCSTKDNKRNYDADTQRKYSNILNDMKFAARIQVKR